jgi:hypothetical protein
MDTHEQSALAITRDIAPMLRELTACLTLPDDHPRRVAALAEKHRLLDLIEQHNAASA